MTITVASPPPKRKNSNRISAEISNEMAVVVIYATNNACRNMYTNTHAAHMHLTAQKTKLHCNICHLITYASLRGASISFALQFLNF